MPRPRVVVLCVIDGLGEAESIAASDAGEPLVLPTLVALRERHATTSLRASGEAVGLPEGARGHGEAGFVTLGAGRVVPSARVRIDAAIATNKLGRNPVLDQLMQIALYDGSPLHLVGLLSTAGIHSSFEHLLALVDLAAFHEIPVVVHAVLDGVDMPRKSAAGLLDRLQLHLEGKRATIGTLSGRHYAMAEEGRWDRAHRAFHAIVRDNALGPIAERAETAFDALNAAYLHGTGDAWVEPVRLGDYQGFRGDYVCDFGGSPPGWEWNGEDCGLVFDHRPDGLRQLTQLLAARDVPEEVAKDLLMDRHFPVRAFREHGLATLVPASARLELPVAFPREHVSSTLAEVLASAGLAELRVAESDRRHHVSTFFDAGRERSLERATLDLVPAPRLVERHDEKPELHVAKVAERAVRGIEAGDHDFVLVHLGNLERVAATGETEATRVAAAALDAALARIAAATEAVGGALLVTSDHGGCERLPDGRGRGQGPHGSSPVPFVLCLDGAPRMLRSGGSLADVAPTVLDLLDLTPPPPMTGRSLLVR
ncbi:MAG: phosphoglycerate mutase (2,3-diphosphoglycerate-independent) [Deltaproteobacteria bacterium]|nr:phosphoglycerate mutase (2,3-diphosphoglycerate-independent) [Deltaproteobacteria bacterium]